MTSSASRHRRGDALVRGPDRRWRRSPWPCTGPASRSVCSRSWLGVAPSRPRSRSSPSRNNNGREGNGHVAAIATTNTPTSPQARRRAYCKRQHAFYTGPTGGGRTIMP